MGEIIVRYGCDGCSYTFENLTDLTQVTVKQIAGYNNGDGFFMERMPRLYCETCVDKYVSPKWDNSYKRNNGGFRAVQT